jgi:integrase
MALRVLDTCPDVQWRLIFGLARWGGLRCPSEILQLTWQDIDFANDRFTVRASKTAHHADGGIRTVPMFPELRPLFQDAFDMANTGDVYCITRYRNNSTNLRTQMHKIISRAGLEPWPKTFQNLRSTRETELFKMTNGNVKAVCSWIGNSPAVAMQHYAQVTEADLQEAAKMTLLDDAKKRVQNPVQTTAELSRTESHKSNMDGDVSRCHCNTNDNYTTPCHTMQKPQEYARQDSNLRPPV